jgi:hypothetical protein
LKSKFSTPFFKIRVLPFYFLNIVAYQVQTRPAWAGFKTAEEGRAKICKFLRQKLKNKSNIEKHIMNNFRTLLEQF